MGSLNRKTRVSLQSGASLYANARLESPRLENKCRVLEFLEIRKGKFEKGALARNKDVVGFNREPIRYETRTRKEKRLGVLKFDHDQQGPACVIR